MGAYSSGMTADSQSSARNGLVSMHGKKSGRLARIGAKLRVATGFQVPVGYQDETGFHFGIRPHPLQLSNRV